MPARLLTCLTVLWLIGPACSPSRKCGGALYYDPKNVSCRPCPMNARFEAGTCVCADERVFKNHQCVAAQSESDAATDAAAAPEECLAYCDFIRVCLAENQLAQAVVPAVITGLNADAPSACADACAAAGGDGALAMCVAEGRAAASCEDVDGEPGLRGALTLLSDCAHAQPEDPLLPVICEGLVQSPLVEDQIDFCD